MAWARSPSRAPARRTTCSCWTGCCPDLEGLELLRLLRARGVATPALMLTALGGVDERVAGLDAGADDYLGKPFAFSELLARVRALGRRPAASAPGSTRRW